MPFILCDYVNGFQKRFSFTFLYLKKEALSMDSQLNWLTSLLRSAQMQEPANFETICLLLKTTPSGLQMHHPLTTGVTLGY